VLFTEPTFLFLFLPVLLALYFATLSREHAAYGNWILLVASVLFYAKGGGAFTWLMLGSIAFNYVMAIAVDRVHGTRAAKRRLAFAVTTNLIVLGIFKYANFFADNVNALLTTAGIAPLVVPRVLLPIGISFFTFHAISYVVDVYRRDATAQKSPVHAALYLLLFPQLIAGPIIRYRDIADQLARRIVTLDDLAYGVRRFVIGLAKKVLIANVVAGPADVRIVADLVGRRRQVMTGVMQIALDAGIVGFRAGHDDEGGRDNEQSQTHRLNLQRAKARPLNGAPMGMVPQACGFRRRVRTAKRLPCASLSLARRISRFLPWPS